MTERPILFSAPMVRAILAGTKSQTRRAVKPQPTGGDMLVADPASPTGFLVGRLRDSENAFRPLACPYGVPGDRLWVREAFCTEWAESHMSGCVEKILHIVSAGPVYRADAPPAVRAEKWRPSIHMPRNFSRITLEVVGVRVERLHAITDSDAIAEGIEKVDELHGVPLWQECGREPWNTVSPTISYMTLWETINGAGSWDANPFVWVVEFKRIMP